MSETNEFRTGSVTVVHEACKFSADYHKASIVLESDETDNFANAITELGSVAVRQLAIGYASSHGVNGASINGNLIGPYAVNSKGQSLDEVKGEDGKPLPIRHELRQPARYRVEVPVSRRIL